MQIRPHPREKKAKRVWLNHEERAKLLDVYSENPDRMIALLSGLHGLRSVEMLGITKRDFRVINSDLGVYKLFIPEESAKSTNADSTNARETPINEQLYQQATIYANSTDRNLDDPLIDVNKRTIRRWIEVAREELAEETGNEDWQYLSLHDLRRTWATDTFFSLSFAGVPIAEELVMSWGGWQKSETGRSTFRQNYLGPVPDHITEQAAEHLQYLQ